MRGAGLAWAARAPVGVALAAMAAAAFQTACSDGAEPSEAARYTYEVVNVYPHDPDAWTQGLVCRGGFLYESTGLYGRSSVRRVRLTTGEILLQRDLAEEYFGEGLAACDGRLLQLTWLARRGFIYDRATLEPRGEFAYASQGWGLAYDGKRLILSDGTPTLRFLHPETYEELGQVEVYDGDEPVSKLNELEFVEGHLYANVHPTDRVARIDVATGRVTAWVDLAGLPKSGGFRPGPGEDLNGIAYDASSGRLFVTGKRWPKLFEIKLIAE
jgi:glutaminyl-peptide cyclotransferase